MILSVSSRGRRPWRDSHSTMQILGSFNGASARASRSNRLLNRSAKNLMARSRWLRESCSFSSNRHPRLLIPGTFSYTRIGTNFRVCNPSKRSLFFCANELFRLTRLISRAGKAADCDVGPSGKTRPICHFQSDILIIVEDGNLFRTTFGIHVDHLQIEVVLFLTSADSPCSFDACSPCCLPQEILYFYPTAVASPAYTVDVNENECAILTCRQSLYYVTTEGGRPRLRRCPSDHSRQGARGARAHVPPVRRYASPGSC